MAVLVAEALTVVVAVVVGIYGGVVVEGLSVGGWAATLYP